MLKIACLRAKLRLIVVCIWIFFLFSSSFIWAQSEEEVHIAPRTAVEHHAPIGASTTNGRPLPSRSEPIRVAVDLVEVPVVVTDEMNRPEVNLNKQYFALFEEDKSQ